MSKTKLQDKPITIGTPFGVEKPINEMRLILDGLDWLEKAYYIAERFVTTIEKKEFVYPETYCKQPTDAKNKFPYDRLTADNDFKATSFFLIGDEKPITADLSNNLSTYDISIIFQLNLDKINPDKLKQGNFVRELMSEAKNSLIKGMFGSLSQIKVKTLTNDILKVYKEFKVADVQKFNRLPMQCFRIDLELTVKEIC